MPKRDIELDLPRLVRRCQAGDQAAWARLVDAFGPLVHGVARNAGLDADDSADVFQATFTTLFKSLDRIESPESLGSWLAVTSGRIAVRTSRAKRAQATSDIEPLSEVLASDERQADELAQLSLDGVRVREALEHIGGKCASLLELLYSGEGASYEEVTMKLGMPIGSIGPTRARCLDRLRKALEESGFFEEPVYQTGAGQPPQLKDG